MEKLFATIEVQPTGHAIQKFSKEKVDPMEITKGEGSCMIFELIDGDYSLDFPKQQLLNNEFKVIRY